MGLSFGDFNPINIAKNVATSPMRMLQKVGELAGGAADTADRGVDSINAAAGKAFDDVTGKTEMRETLAKIQGSKDFNPAGLKPGELPPGLDGEAGKNGAKAIGHTGGAFKAITADMGRDGEAVGAGKVAENAPYSVKAGDTLSKIADEKGTTLEKLMEANKDITDANQISVGQEIKLGDDQPQAGGSAKGMVASAGIGELKGNDAPEQAPEKEAEVSV